MQSLVQSYTYQFTNGCDKIDCSNEYCRKNDKFIYSDLNSKELQSLAISCAQSHHLVNHLCKAIPYNIQYSNLETEIKDFRTFVLNFITYDKINTKETIYQLRKNMTDLNMFSLFLRENDLPLSRSNSSIDDGLFFEFSNKLSSIIHLNAAVLDCLNIISQKIINSSNANTEDETYSLIRSLLILFYFPAILTPTCFNTILSPLLNCIEKLSKNAKQIIIQWILKLPRLFIQIVGVIHFAISMYFSSHSRPNIHSEEILRYLKVLSIFYEANDIMESSFPPSTFYNHHINESLNIQEELELRHTLFPTLFKTPFVLSMKTKAAICKIESEQYMGIFAYRSLLLNVFTTNRNNDLFLTLRIRRDHLIDDAVTQLSMQHSLNFLKKLRIVFEGEPAIDVGGPSREFLYLVSEQLFSPDHGMFITVNNHKYHWFSQVSFEGDRSFFLVGAVVGLAIHNSIVLPIRLPRVVYKRLLTPSKPLTLNDLRQIDPQLASSLSIIDQMVQKGEDVSALMLTFTATVDCFGHQLNVPLVENMQDVEVNNDNAEFYIGAYINFVLVKSIESCFEAFRRGFELSCKSPSYKLLDPAEIDILVSGEENFDWGALQRGAIYKDGYTHKSRAVKWFWEIFADFSTKEKLMFLKFATGTDRAPVGGLGNLQIVIQRGADYNRLPVSHTCFNVFTLPDYRSKKQLLDNVLLAIQHTEGFGIV